MRKFKQLIAGIIIGAIVFGVIPVMAANGTKSISAVFKNIKVTLDGKAIKTSAEPFQYNGKVYVPSDLITQMSGKKVNFNTKTNTVEVGSANKKVTITNSGFTNSGTTTLYNVFFSDGFYVGMGIPKSNLPNSASYEVAVLAIDATKVDKDIEIKTPSIIGFSDTFNEKYYPLSFGIYSDEMPDSIKPKFKESDLFENFKSFNTSRNITGMVVYDSFVKLEGVSYDDGVHKCKLYFEDKQR